MKITLSPKSKWLWFPLVLPLLAIAAVTVTPGKKISQYPNKAVPVATDMMIWEQVSPSTNVHTTFLQLSNTIARGVTNIIGNSTTGFATTNYVVQQITNRVFVAAGSTNVGIVTNYGANGTVTYTVYATNDGGGSFFSMPFVARPSTVLDWNTNRITQTITTNTTYTFANVANDGDKRLLDVLVTASATFTLPATVRCGGTNTFGGTNGGWLVQYWYDGVETNATVEFRDLAPARGTLFVGDGNAIIPLAVGSDGTVPVADSTQAGGIAWTSQAASATNAITGVWSNGVNVATPATNLNFIFALTSGVTLSNVNGRVDVILQTMSGDSITNLLILATNTATTSIFARVLEISNYLATNFTAGAGGGTNFNSILVTNQVFYVPRGFSGSNGTANIITNLFDVSKNTFNRMTNTLDNNHVFQFSNITAGASFVHHFPYGSAFTTRTVSYRLPGGGTSGTNIFWYSPTNGSFDFNVVPGAAYTVAGFVDAQTNVVINMNSTTFVPVNYFEALTLVSSNIYNTNFNGVNITATVAGISNVVSTNLTVSAAASISNLFAGRMLATNAFVKAGGSATNAAIGGTISVQAAPIASAGAAETNLMSYTVPAHALTNDNDRILFRASGRFAATANAKEIKVVYGSETIFATSSQIVNSGAWSIEGEIIRTGSTAQSAVAEFHGAGITLFTTASAIVLAQTNGIATVLKLTGTAIGDGDITNRTLTVEWMRAP